MHEQRLTFGRGDTMKLRSEWQSIPHLARQYGRLGPRLNLILGQQELGLKGSDDAGINIFLLPQGTFAIWIP
jgi:hypothetical protein